MAIMTCEAGLRNSVKPGAIAITTALGYNQLLSTNSVELLAEQGRWLVETHEEPRVAEATGAKAGRVGDEESPILREDGRRSRSSVRDDWNLHERLGRTPKGLGIHALNLDVDIGPLLQAQKLMNVGECSQR